VKLTEIFNVAYGNKLDMNKMLPSEAAHGIAFVGRKGSDQGLSGYVEPLSGLPPYPAGRLTVALGGSRLLSTFVQQRPFYTAQNVAVLTPIEARMPLLHKLYYAACIQHNSFRYTAFGREANRTLGTLDLPDMVPSWVDDVATPDFAGVNDAAAAASPLPELHEFRVGDVFDVSSGKYVPAIEKRAGDTITVTSSAQNNGWQQRLALDPIFSGGVISVARNGSVGSAFFQPRPFFGTDDVRVWAAKKGSLTPEEGLFICAVIELEKFRYSYGRKWSVQAMQDTKIRLPRQPGGAPDWQAMTTYIQGLPFSSSLNSIKD
jgi:hypothetical protein